MSFGKEHKTDFEAQLRSIARSRRGGCSSGNGGAIFVPHYRGPVQCSA